MIRYVALWLASSAAFWLLAAGVTNFVDTSTFARRFRPPWGWLAALLWPVAAVVLIGVGVAGVVSEIKMLRYLREQDCRRKGRS